MCPISGTPTPASPATCSRGGAVGGGATVTPTGQQVLAHYRALESLLLDAGAADLMALNALLRPEGSG